MSSTSRKAISGSLRRSRRSRTAAGGGWQGRRSEGILLGFRGSRTPPGGDRRSSRGRRGLRRGPLVLLLRRLLAEVGLDDAWVRTDLGRLALGDLLAVVEHRDVLGDLHDH